MSVFQSSYLCYAETERFTKIIIDYINGSVNLKDFYYGN